MESESEPVTSLAMLLSECGLSHLSENLASERLTIGDMERTQLLATLKASGVGKLGERQACATAIAKAKKAGRLRPGNPLDVPPASAGAPAVSFAAAPAGALKRKPRIVLLHGGSTNPQILDVQCAPLVKRVKDEFELLHVEGHLAAKSDSPMALMLKRAFGPLAERLRDYATTVFDSRGWWTYSGTCDTALRNLERSLAETGDVDFLLGFSQGANFAAMLAARAAMRLPGSRPPFRGVILLEPDLCATTRNGPRDTPHAYCRRR